MVDRVGFQVEGLAKVVRGLQALGVEVEDLKDAFGSIADEGARKAAQFAPKRTGRLAANVRGNRAKSKAVIRAGGVSVPYAGVINYGWAAHGIAASQFMQRADEAMRPDVLRLLEKNINDAIRRHDL